MKPETPSNVISKLDRMINGLTRISHFEVCESYQKLAYRWMKRHGSIHDLLVVSLMYDKLQMSKSRMLASSHLVLV